MNQSNSSWASNGFKIAPFGKGRNAIQSVHANDLVDALNMLGTITIIRGTEDKVVYADNGVIIQLAPEGESGDGGGGGTGVILRGIITDLFKNYVTVGLWGGSAFDGGSINVAKPPELRHVATDTVYGIAVTYTYPTGGTDLNDTNSRTAGASGYDTENHKVILPYEEGRQIYFMDTGSSVGTETGLSGITHIDLNIAGRAWASVPALPIP